MGAECLVLAYVADVLLLGGRLGGDSLRTQTHIFCLGAGAMAGHWLTAGWSVTVDSTRMVAARLLQRGQGRPCWLPVGAWRTTHRLFQGKVGDCHSGKQLGSLGLGRIGPKGGWDFLNGYGLLKQ